MKKLDELMRKMLSGTADKALKMRQEIVTLPPSTRRITMYVSDLEELVTAYLCLYNDTYVPPQTKSQTEYFH